MTESEYPSILDTEEFCGKLSKTEEFWPGAFCQYQNLIFFPRRNIVSEISEKWEFRAIFFSRKLTKQ